MSGDEDASSGETLSGGIERLRAAGFGLDFYATEDGSLGCRSCGTREDPATVTILHTVRYEGDSNPDDESILLAIECRGGGRGLYTAAFGPSTSPEDAALLRRLPRAIG